MVILKKQILNYKIQNLITNNPFLIFFQFNNVNTKEWHLIKSKLAEVANTPTLVVKNKIAHKLLNSTNFTENADKSSLGIQKNSEYKNFLKKKQFLKKSFVSESVAVLPKTVFQGPTLMVGFASLEELQAIYNILNKTPNLIFIGGLFQNQIINHLDLEKIIKLDTSVYANLVQECLNPSKLFFFFKNLIDFKILTSVQENLLQVLTIRADQLRSEKSDISNNTPNPT